MSSSEKITEHDLRNMAETACAESNGFLWRTMADVDQQSQIAAWMDGYRQGSNRPYFKIKEVGWGTGWTAGDALTIENPLFNYMKNLFEKYEQWNNNERSDEIIIHTDALDDFLRWYKNQAINK